MNALSDFKPEQITMAPWAAELFQQRGASFAKGHPFDTLPAARCASRGCGPVPRKIVQSPGLIVVLYEELTTFRQIYTDGRKLPVDPQPSFLGYSIGRWEGDWLVIEAMGFKDRGWLDASDIRTAMPCASWSAFVAATLAPWRSK